MLKNMYFALVFLLAGTLSGNHYTFASYGDAFEKISNAEAVHAEEDPSEKSPYDNINDEDDEDDEDPLEGLNRVIFAFNELFDAILLRPIAVTYDFIFPDPIKKGIGNVFNNLSEPVTFINDILQLKFDRAGETFSRFTLNTTFGLGGIFDVADEFGDIKRHKEDFGQTLGNAGVDRGPYLVLPFIGPSNFRDMIGTAVDIITDPVDYGLRRIDRDHLIYVRKGMDLTHKRASALSLTDSIDKAAPDKYVRYRTLYNQYRHFKIQDGETSRSEEDSIEMVE